jgi:hypothetical protein
LLRTLSKFFGSADRDDVLLVYFSGHGKLDQNGRTVPKTCRCPWVLIQRCCCEDASSAGD